MKTTAQRRSPCDAPPRPPRRARHCRDSCRAHRTQQRPRRCGRVYVLNAALPPRRLVRHPPPMACATSVSRDIRPARTCPRRCPPPQTMRRPPRAPRPRCSARAGPGEGQGPGTHAARGAPRRSARPRSRPAASPARWARGRLSDATGVRGVTGVTGAYCFCYKTPPLPNVRPHTQHASLA